MDKKEIGRKISATRKELGMTQKDLAEKLHVTDKSVSKWETGAHFPDIAIMENLAAALRISVVELLGLEYASSEEMIAEMALISMEEKKSIVKEIINRGWLSVIIGLMILTGIIYKGVGRQWFVWFASNVYHRNVRLYRRIDFKRHRFHI